MIGKLKRHKEEEDPTHPEVQVTLKKFFNLIEEIITNQINKSQSEVESIIKQSKLPLSEFPTLFTIEEENYIKEAMKQFNK